METLIPRTLKISDSGPSGSVEFVRKNRNDCPIVIEVDPNTRDTRFIRMSPEEVDALILLLQSSRGLICECPDERFHAQGARYTNKVEKEVCFACNKSIHPEDKR
jgi:hypothetical protein